MKNNENSLLEAEEKEKFAYQYYLNAGGSIEKIKMYAKRLNLTLEGFFQCIANYTKRNLPTPEYVTIFNKLLSLKTKESVIEYMNKIPYDLKFLRNNILAYFFYHRPDIYFLKPEIRDSLIKKLDVYYVYLKELDDSKHQSQKRNSLEYATSMIQSFIKSQYSIERFCFNNSITINSLKKYGKMQEGENSNLYKQYQENINLKEEIKERDIASHVYKLLDKIKELGNDFSIIDLLTTTIYGINELVKVADTILNKEDRILFRKSIRPFITIKNITSNGINNLLTSVLILNIDGNLIEMSLEDKQAAICFLQERNIPICSMTFHDAITRLFQDKLNTKKHK